MFHDDVIPEALTMGSRSRAVACEVQEREPIPSAGYESVLHSAEFRLLSDEALVDLTRAGDNPAFDELVERYCASIYGLALSVLKNQDDAGDALCRAFLSARRDIDSIGEECSPGTWLYLHGLRAVFQTLSPARGRFSIVDRTGD